MEREFPDRKQSHSFNQKDEMILTIPEKIIFCKKTCLDNKKLRPIYEIFLEKNLENEMFAFQILFEMNLKNSFWKPYLGNSIE